MGTMIPTLLIAVARAQDSIPNGCDIDGYTTRIITEAREQHPAITYCRNPDQSAGYSDPDGNSVCKVSTDMYKCCAYDSLYTLNVHCFKISEKNQCPVGRAGKIYDHVRWCPATEPALSAGATAGIVVGGILGPFALGLAYKTLT